MEIGHAALPNARYQTLSGQTHTLMPKAHASVLVEFFHRERGGKSRAGRVSSKWAALALKRSS